MDLSMGNVVQDRYTIAMHGLCARVAHSFACIIPRAYTLTRGLWARNPLLPIVYPIHRLLG